MKSNNPIFTKIAASADEFKAIRHTLHENPEVGFEESKTSDLVAEKLKSWGYKVDRGLAKTGVVGTLKVGDGKKILGIRADMDALPMTGDNGKPWASKIPNRFHGCGHDGHTTTLLAAAKYLAETKNFNGTLRVIFQPAEELLYGGKVMVEDGLFEKFPCDMVYGFHNMPPYPAGHFYFREGPFMASCDTVNVEITGIGSHGAVPEGSIDATVVGCYIVTALQTVVARNVSPFDKAVVTVGSFKSGDASNIINSKANLKLSIRTLDKDVRELVLNKVYSIINHQAEGFGAKAEIDHVNGCPVLENNPETTRYGIEIARELFGDEYVHTDAKQMMASEDFSFMVEANPNSAYFFMGNGEGKLVHNPGYDFNDDIIVPGATFWCALTEKYLK